MRTNHRNGATDFGSTETADVATTADASATNAVERHVRRVAEIPKHRLLKTVVFLAFLASISLVYSPAARSLVFSPLVLAAVTLSVVPAGFVALYIRESHPGRPTPLAAVAAVTGAGYAAVASAYVLNESALPAFESLGALGFLVFLTLFVGPMEEAIKMAALYLYPGDRTLSPMDGAVLGAFVGLGFAFGENTLYLVSHGLLGSTDVAELLVGRAGVAPLHVLWSSVAGYYLVKARAPPASTFTAVKAVVAIGLLHGVYNAGVFTAPAAAQTTSFGGGAGYLALSLTVYAAAWYAVERLIRAERSADERPRSATQADDASPKTEVI